MCDIVLAMLYVLKICREGPGASVLLDSIFRSAARSPFAPTPASRIIAEPS